MSSSAEQRRLDLSANIAEVESRIAAACADAGRRRDELILIVITKTYPASDVVLLADLGITDVGENRHPEAGDKLDELHDLASNSSSPRMHFVGGLQTNKANAVTRYADVIHSVDRLKLVAALEKGAANAGRMVECLVQVELDDPARDPGQAASERSGADPSQVMAIAEAIEAAAHLRLGGVMAVAPLGADPRLPFDQLAEVAATVRQRFPSATTISAGMSGDLEYAVKAGATHLRIGRSVLGERPPTG